MVGIAVRGNVTLNGSNVFDSFDSSNPAYSTNGKYDDSRRKDGANIATLDNATPSIISIGSSVKVYGKLLIGPGDSVSVNGSGAVGSSNWISSGAAGIQSGWFMTDLPIFAVSNSPTPPVTGLSLPPKSTYSLDGTNYSTSYLLANADYVINTRLTLSSNDKILVSGQVRIHFATNFSLFANSQILLSTNSSLTIYSSGNLDFGGAGIANPRNAAHFRIFGQTNCLSVQFAGGKEVSAYVYAPHANISINGGGTIPLSFSGAVVGNSFLASGKVLFHHDEAVSTVAFTYLDPFQAYLWHAPYYSTSNTSLVFRVWFAAGYTQALESSTNLVDWERVQTNTQTFYFTNTDLSSPQKFFRTVYLP